MPIVVEGPAVPVHSIAFRASSLKQAQELARFAAPFDGTLSPARHPDRSAPAEPVRPRVPGPPPALRSPHLARTQIDLQPRACCEAGHGQREIIGAPCPARDIPARSRAVAIADHARRHNSGSWPIEAHNPVEGGRDITAVAVLAIVVVGAQGEHRVTCRLRGRHRHATACRRADRRRRALGCAPVLRLSRGRPRARP